jgi:hypothetical protein
VKINEILPDIICPQQHASLYIIRLQQMLKLTPPNHSDRRDLLLCLHVVKTQLVALDRVTGLAQLKADWAKILEKTPQRDRFEQLSVQRICPVIVAPDSPGRLCLFEHEMAFLADVRDGFSLERFEKFDDIVVECFAARSLVVRTDTDTVFSFAETEQRDRAFGLFRMSAIQRPRSNFLRWAPYDNEVWRCYHSIAVTKTSGKAACLVFGGQDEELQPTAQVARLVDFSDETHDYCPLQAAGLKKAPAGRYHAAMASINETLYVYGGTSDGVIGLGDFWRFQGTWSQMAFANGPPAGFGYDLVVSQDQKSLLLAGGNTDFGFYVYSLRSKTWAKIGEEWSLGPSVGHKIFLSEESGSGYLFGANVRDGSTSERVILFRNWGASKSVLRTRGRAPVRTAGASFGRIGPYVFVIGAADLQVDAFLDLRTLTWRPLGRQLEDGWRLMGAASYTLGNEMFLHGGMYEQTERVSGTVYRVSLRKEEAGPHEYKTEVDDEVMRRIADPSLVLDAAEFDWAWYEQGRKHSPPIASPSPGRKGIKPSASEPRLPRKGS